GDAIAAREGITRADVDALGYDSQQKASRAIAEGRFDKSLIAVLNEDGSVALDHEEFPRPQTTLEGLGQLKASFDAIADYDLGGMTFRQLIQLKYPDLNWTGIHHAGNSSGVVDGAAGILLASKGYAEKHGLKPRARIVAFANQGDCPTLMLNAPVPATHKVLSRTGL
ncbi:MAG: acetyl-CoA C-acyltransferase, partial [Erythrobacter sp.]